MARTMYHSEMTKLGPVKVTVKSDVLESKYSKPNAPKPPYVLLEVDGQERTFNLENENCAAVFDGKKGQTISICAEGSREDATITLVGHEVPAQQPPRQPARAAAPPAARQPAAHRPAAAASASVENHEQPLMRAGEVRYSRKVGLPNYCSEEISIVVFLEPGAKAAEALAYAKKFVESHLMKSEK